MKKIVVSVLCCAALISGLIGGGRASASENEIDINSQISYLEELADGNQVTTLTSTQTRMNCIYVTQTHSGKVNVMGASSINFDQKINGKRHKGTLYYQKSVINKTNWTYTWTYTGYVYPV